MTLLYYDFGLYAMCVRERAGGSCRGSDEPVAHTAFTIDDGVTIVCSFKACTMCGSEYAAER